MTIVANRNINIRTRPHLTYVTHSSDNTDGVVGPL